MNKKQKEFLDLYEPIHERFERFCRARVYGDMDFRDLMNETLLKAYQKFEDLRSKEAFLSFLFSISVRILANNKRKHKEVPKDFVSEGSGENTIKIPDVNSKSDVSTDVYFLHKALAQLTEDQRESIILFEISGFSIKEIAEIQNTSESSVKQRLRRGRIRLKEILTYVGSTETVKTSSYAKASDDIHKAPYAKASDGTQKASYAKASDGTQKASYAKASDGTQKASYAKASDGTQKASYAKASDGTQKTPYAKASGGRKEGSL